MSKLFLTADRSLIFSFIAVTGSDCGLSRAWSSSNMMILFCLQIGNLLRELVWWRSCSSRTMLFAYSSSFRTSEVGLPLPRSACMCSRIFVWLSVMWIISSSGSHTIAAPVSETRVRELVRGLIRWIWTNWDALSSLLEMARVIHLAPHIV